uniref:ANK_REP_REGION domain-containing protein n=1 Tax=Globodera pallida TaxID=36090 RepID=A0A183BKI4_GLOPA
MANYDDSGSSSSGTNSARQQAKFIALAESGDAVQMPSLLRTFNANANLLSASLITAAKNGNTEMARLMLEHGADPQKTGTEMLTAN